jgi:hypothetical protein
MPNQDNRHVPDLEGGLGESFEDRRRRREAEAAARAERGAHAPASGRYVQRHEVQKPTPEKGGLKLSRHLGTLSESYKQELDAKSIEDIAALAAKLRSDGRTCGTATAKILEWAKRHKVSPDAVNVFMALYRAAWTAEKAARAAGRSTRPENRPVKGGRHRLRGRRDRVGFVAHSY